jgi:hypothetical protein
VNNELEDAPLFALHAAEREVLKRLARDNQLLAQLRKELRRRSRAPSGDKTSTQA